jgi:hypothetical protein
MTANTATKTNETETPVVEVEVVSSDTAPETEATAEAVAMDPKEQQAVQQRMANERHLSDARSTFSSALEENGHYSDFGFVYAAGAPLDNSLGAEVGIVTKDQDTGLVQRSGIGFYVRCDHWSNAFAPTPADKKPAI